MNKENVIFTYKKKEENPVIYDNRATGMNPENTVLSEISRHRRTNTT